MYTFGAGKVAQWLAALPEDSGSTPSTQEGWLTVPVTPVPADPKLSSGLHTHDIHI